MGSSPFIHQTPGEAIQQVVRRQIRLNTQSFEISYPGDPDALLDHPETHAAFHKDEYMPYWADLWPSSKMLGQALLETQTQSPGAGKLALEVGCGVGLPGIVALSLGFRVIFSDYDRAALDFAQRNALANGFTEEQFELLPLDWRSPPTDLKVDLLLASDVIYERRNIDPLMHLMKTVVKPDGNCWLVDPDRPFQAEFEAALKRSGLVFEKIAVATTLDSSASNFSESARSNSDRPDSVGPDSVGLDAKAQPVNGHLFKVSQV